MNDSKNDIQKKEDACTSSLYLSLCCLSNVYLSVSWRVKSDKTTDRQISMEFDI